MHFSSEIRCVGQIILRKEQQQIGILQIMLLEATHEVMHKLSTSTQLVELIGFNSRFNA